MQEPETAYTRLDLMNDLHELVWENQEATAYTRIAQYAFVKMLLTKGGYLENEGKGGGLKLPFLNAKGDECSLVMEGKEDMNAMEMNAIYNYELARLKKLLKKRSKQGDEITRIHYQNLYDQIENFK